MKKAFSLIELSIVILIIGILVAGVTQSSRLVSAMRLQSAQSLTMGSPVGSVSGLTLWLETTLEKSIDQSQTSQGTEITNWYDLNPQTTSLSNATQTTAGRRPTYNYSSTLPLINFNGATNGQFFNLPNNTIPSGDSGYTIFLVARLAGDAPARNNDVVVAGLWANPITLIRMDNGSGLKFTNFTGGGASTVYWPQTANLPSNTLTIFTAGYKNIAPRILTSHINTNQLVSISVADARTTGIDYNMIGGNSWANNEFFRGDIGEIIIYNRYLKNDERLDIEKYLAKKWGIKI